MPKSNILNTTKKINSIKETEKDTMHIKYHMVINRPFEKGITREVIENLLVNNFKSLLYFCLSEEKGEEGTHHFHVYVVFRTSVRFSQMKKFFKEAHIEPARGTSEQNRQYIKKEGKWNTDTKHGTSIPRNIL